MPRIAAAVQLILVSSEVTAISPTFISAALIRRITTVPWRALASHNLSISASEVTRRIHYYLLVLGKRLFSPLFFSGNLSLCLDILN